jgi:hypothetical protein
MKPKNLYLLLCMVGAFLPYTQFLPFLRQNGLDFHLFFDQLFSNRVSSFCALDLIVSSFVLWVLVYIEGRRAGMRRLWIPVIASLTVGVSLALPLFLYMREARIQASMWAGGRCEM